MAQQPRASLSLFPSANISNPQPPTIRNQTPLGRRSESRERRTPTPQHQQQPSGLGLRAASPQASPPRNGRQTPQGMDAVTNYTPAATQALTAHPVDYHEQTQEQDRQQQQDQYQYHYHQAQQPQHLPIPQTQPNAQWPLAGQPQVYIQEPSPVADPPRRAGDGLTELEFVPREQHLNNQSRSSIAKVPLSDDPSVLSPPQPLQSMFPTYNPDIALEHQQYMPTAHSPTHIPRAVISRQGIHMPEDDDENHAPVLSPDRTGEGPRRWPRIPQQPPAVPTVCTTEQLKSLWRVANGWRASPSEGRIYCLKLAQEKDAPVYTLSSQTQPFWNLRLDPTSVSARVTLTRHDPTKPFKAPKPEGDSPSIFRGSMGSGSLSRASDTSKSWTEALTTTTEEESRRHQPNDGLVALLMPSPAKTMASERSEAPAAVQMAENECGRLVWDDDTSTYFLVHSALQKPFFVSIERSPAWSRTEYTLEHTESPQHLAKLTRDGSGGGWLELDTGLASKIDSFFILDVTVSALILVASLDEKNSPSVAVESFEAPPVPKEPAGGKNKSKKQDKAAKKQPRKMEEFEIDIESQDDSLGKDGPTTKVKERKTEDRLPFVLRAIVKLTKGVFKLFILILTGIAKMFGLVFKCFYKCVGSKY
ncbi:acetylserotonin methytransferase-like protein [Sarocladium implicatum]|nr:acetylserotonin methytransferase-like protein [Sarocladium implicatum]